MEITEIQKGFDSNSGCFTISLKINGVIFESVAFSETERDNIYTELIKEPNHTP